MEEYIEAFKRKKKNYNERVCNDNKKLKLFISRFLIAVIFFLSSLIFTNISDKNLLMYKEYVLTESLPFTKIKGWYEDIFGEVLPSQEKSVTVFNGKLIYKDINDYLDGEALTVGSKTIINSLSSGVVVFIGEKDGYGNTIIIQGTDGVDIWYGNLDNTAVNLYDYIEKDSILGETIDDKLYLVIKKDDEFIKYEDYQN